MSKKPIVSCGRIRNSWDVLESITSKMGDHGENVRLALSFKEGRRKRIRSVTASWGWRTTCECCGPWQYLEVRDKDGNVMFERGW